MTYAEMRGARIAGLPLPGRNIGRVMMTPVRLHLPGWPRRRELLGLIDNTPEIADYYRRRELKQNREKL